jgi:ADP-heptose:LPS heptosyltransferase
LCKSLTGKTTIHELFALAQKAEVAIGNDTGPMHAASASGCKTIVLYSAESDPALCAQRGPDVTILREGDLSDIATDRVIELLTPEMKQNQT